MKRQQDAPASTDQSELEQQLETLRRDVRRLLLEKDLLLKANELLKKELGIDRQLLTNREKTQLVDALRPTYTLTELLCEVDLPRSSYFYHRARLEVADKYVEVRQASGIHPLEHSYPGLEMGGIARGSSSKLNANNSKLSANRH